MDGKIVVPNILFWGLLESLPRYVCDTVIFYLRRLAVRSLDCKIVLGVDLLNFCSHHLIRP